MHQSLAVSVYTYTTPKPQHAMRTGVAGARAGTLSFMVGGPQPSVTLAKPYLSLMGARTIHCGSSGSGLAAKICNNMILGVQQIVVAEGMLLGKRMGLEPAVLAGVLNTSTGTLSTRLVMVI
jgi:3-hydroxyisobutyrate dehydrogenase